MLNSDEQVLERSLRRPAAFEELVRRHSALVHGYLQRRSSCQVADDLLSETWLQAFTARGSYDAGREPVRAWIFGVARHVLASDHRRRQHAGAEYRQEPRADPSSDWDAIDARLDASALAPALRSGLAGLAEGDRELLLLVIWEQLAPTEAAAVLGIPAGTARSRLHRARHQLRQHMTQAADHPAAPSATHQPSRRSS